MDNFYGLTVVRNLLLWYPDANNAEGPPLRYTRIVNRGGRRGFPCLHIPRKAVSELYREKIESLQAEESRSAGAEGCGAKRGGGDGAAGGKGRRRAGIPGPGGGAPCRGRRPASGGSQAEAERQAMLDRTEKDCEALRAAAMARMDDAVDYLLEKVVKR